MNGLVYIGKVINKYVIPNADQIESLEVVCGPGGKWCGITQKEQFGVGDTCLVYLQDSLLPKIAEFSFMEKKKWRVKMCRLRGVPSEVLIMPQTIDGKLGQDVTAEAGVTKYEKPLPVNISGDIFGGFPNFIPKTDEPNFQTVPEMVNFLYRKAYYSTVKVDGTSATCFRNDERFGCCSRNLELKYTPNNIIWKIAEQYNLENILPVGVAIQFEIIGPGIQKNPMGLAKIEPRLFNVWEIKERRYWNYEEIRKFVRAINFPMVKVIDDNKIFDFPNNDAIRLYAEGNYDNGKPREGVVIRPTVETKMTTDRVSFKVINLNYKD